MIITLFNKLCNITQVVLKVMFSDNMADSDLNSNKPKYDYFRSGFDIEVFFIFFFNIGFFYFFF